MSQLLTTLLFAIGTFVVPMSTFAMDVCASYREQECTPECDSTCTYQTCTVQSSSISVELLKNLPFQMHIPPNCRDSAGAYVNIVRVPFDLSTLGYDWQTHNIPHPDASVSYPICSSVSVAGPACAPPVGSCPAGKPEITAGPNIGKCSGGCNPTTHLAEIYNTDGSLFTTVPGQCGAACTPATHCANYVHCYYKNRCTGDINMGTCASAGSGTLACGASVTYAACNDVIDPGTSEIIKDCIFWSVDIPAPPGDVDFMGGMASPVACGAPTTTTTTTTLPPTCANGATDYPTCSLCPSGQGIGMGGNCEPTVNCTGEWTCSVACAPGSEAGGVKSWHNTVPNTGGGTCAHSEGEVNGTCNFYPSCAGGGGGGGCFVGGTQISMADGSHKSIELVKAGDLVITMDEQTGENIVAPVTETHHHAPKMQEIYEFKMANGAVLISNNIHPIFVAEKDAYYKAEQILVMYLLGERLSFIDASGKAIQINTIDHYQKETSVYNFEVSGMNKMSTKLGAYGQGHNYFAEGFLVHNALYTTEILKFIYFNWIGEMSHAFLHNIIKN